MHLIFGEKNLSESMYINLSTKNDKILILPLTAAWIPKWCVNLCLDSLVTDIIIYIICLNVIQTLKAPKTLSGSYNNLYGIDIRILDDNADPIGDLPDSGLFW